MSPGRQTTGRPRIETLSLQLLPRSLQPSGLFEGFFGSVFSTIVLYFLLKNLSQVWVGSFLPHFIFVFMVLCIQAL